MPKLTIQNRKNQNIVLILDQAKNAKGLAFVMHGLGGFKEQPHIQAMANAFKENNYTVVNFDATNSLGQSGGKIEDVTATAHDEDLEDVIKWAQSQPWYKEPFCLAGHSLGSMSVVLYAENFPEKVKAIAPISTVISGKLVLLSYPKEDLEEWEKSGLREEISRSKPGAIKRLLWSFILDILKYDLLKKVDKLTMPVLLIVGERDKSTPVKYQKILYEKLPAKKELHVIKGSGHTFREKEHIEEVKNILSNWIKKLDA
ncbi:alpha/beta hydrolase [Patescibacteria group bacterium]|nr:alpha/beta hydrolase [Patescibacteria group bacterium]